MIELGYWPSSKIVLIKSPIKKNLINTILHFPYRLTELFILFTISNNINDVTWFGYMVFNATFNNISVIL
jgi:hypothetical protein